MKKKTSLVILCGGKGSRLGKITKKTPKPLIEINGKPFIEHLINFYQRYDFENIFLVGFYKGNRFKKFFKNKVYNFIKSTFIIEDKPSDTAGALNAVRSKVRGDIVVINGDSYLDYDFDKFDKFHNSHRCHSMILLKNKNYKTNNKLNNLKIKNNFVNYDKKNDYMNGGIYYFNKNIFKNIPKNKKTSIENELLPPLIKSKKIKGIISKGFFIDIGTKKNLDYAKKKLLKKIKKPAIFLDRDGVLNVDNGYDYKFSKMKWINNTLTFLSKLKKDKIKFFIVTNQSGIGRGMYSEKIFLQLQKKIKKFLLKKNIFIDDIKYCPHHPTFGVGKYKKSCNCRKPNNQMISDIIRGWSIDINKSIMIGDKETDFIAAKKSSIKFYYQNKKNLNKITRIFQKINFK